MTSHVGRSESVLARGPRDHREHRGSVSSDDEEDDPYRNFDEQTMMDFFPLPRGEIHPQVARPGDGAPRNSRASLHTSNSDKRHSHSSRSSVTSNASEESHRRSHHRDRPPLQSRELKPPHRELDDTEYFDRYDGPYYKQLMPEFRQPSNASEESHRRSDHRHRPPSQSQERKPPHEELDDEDYFDRHHAGYYEKLMPKLFTRARDSDSDGSMANNQSDSEEGHVLPSTSEDEHPEHARMPSRHDSIRSRGSSSSHTQYKGLSRRHTTHGHGETSRPEGPNSRNFPHTIHPESPDHGLVRVRSASSHPASGESLSLLTHTGHPAADQFKKKRQLITLLQTRSPSTQLRIKI